MVGDICDRSMNPMPKWARQRKFAEYDGSEKECTLSWVGPKSVVLQFLMSLLLDFQKPPTC